MDLVFVSTFRRPLLRAAIYMVSQKKFYHLRFSENFPLWLRIFNQNFMHLLYVHIDTKLQFFSVILN